MSIDIEFDAWQRSHFASIMAHMRAAGNNDPVLSGMIQSAIKGAWLAARATPQAPTPAAAEGQEEISYDQCIELAEELQREWMRKSIAETRTAASLFDAGGFRAGMETACDEIETRMALDGDTLLAVAAWQAEVRQEVAYLLRNCLPSLARCGQKSLIHEVNTFLDAAPLPRQAAVQGEWISVADWLPFPDLDESGNTPMVLVKWRRDSRAENLTDIDVSNVVYLARNVAAATHWMLLPAAPQTTPDQAKSAPATTEKDA
jgi:hypothetical protein